MTTNLSKEFPYFITCSHGPRIAVLASNEARHMCWKNNLTIDEFFAPFCDLTHLDLTVRDPTGASGTPNSSSLPNSNTMLGTYILKHLHLNVREVEDPTQTKVGNTSPDHATNEYFYNLQNELNSIAFRLLPPDEETYQIITPTTTLTTISPWYTSYREYLLRYLPVLEYEYIRYYVAVLLLVSSTQADPISVFDQLKLKLSSYCQSQLSKKKAHNTPKFLMQHMYICYVLVHDIGQGDIEDAQKIYQEVQNKFSSANSYFLRINSNSCHSSHIENSDTYNGQTEVDTSLENNMSENNFQGPWNTLLVKNRDLRRRNNIKSSNCNQNSTDNTSKKSKIQEIPDLLTSSILNECNDSKEILQTSVPGLPIPNETGQYMTSKDVQRMEEFMNYFAKNMLIPHLESTLRVLYERVNSQNKFSRFFSRFTGKYTSKSNQTVGVDINNELYSTDAIELQMRMLGDIAFILQNWELSYNMFHSVKKDFQNDQAWWLYSGAVEMTALNVCMQPSIKKDPHTYFEEAFQQYLTILETLNYSLRTLVLWGEALRSRGLHQEAVSVYIRLSGRVDDLCSALLLEQAAICCLSRNPPRQRKSAQLFVLASHAFTKAGHVRHSVCVLKRALQTIKGKEWISAEDFLLRHLGLHSTTLCRKEVAYSVFESLLSHDSKIYYETIPPYKQETTLSNFLNCYQAIKGYNDDNWVIVSSSYNTTQHLTSLPIPKVESALIRTSWCAGSPEMAFTAYHRLHPDLARYYINSPDVEISLLKDLREIAELKQRAPGFAAKISSKSLSKVGRGPSADNPSSPLSPLLEPKLSSGVRPALSIGLPQFSHSGSLEHNDWLELEVESIKLATRRQPVLSNFRSLTQFNNSKTINTLRGICVRGECICVEILLRNPLSACINLKNICLQWALEDESADYEHSVTSEVVPNYKLPACGQRLLQLHLQPQCTTGILHVTGILYSLEPDYPIHNTLLQAGNEVITNEIERAEKTLSAQGVLELSVRGKRLNSTKEHKTSPMYTSDLRLQWEIVPAMPRLFLRLFDWPTKLLSGQTYTLPVELYNCGTLPLQNLIVSSPESDSFIFDFSTQASSKNPPVSENNMTSLETSRFMLTQNNNRSQRILEYPLEPGNAAIGTCMIRAPDQPGEHEVNTLYYYDSTESKAHSLTHRTHTHTTCIQVQPSLKIESFITKFLPSSSIDKIDNCKYVHAYGSILIENESKYGSAGVLNITSINCISKDWISKPLVFNTETILTLRPEQSTLVHFTAERLIARDLDCNSDPLYNFSNIFSIQSSDVNNKYNQELLCRSAQLAKLNASTNIDDQLIFRIQWENVLDKSERPTLKITGEHWIIPKYVDTFKDPFYTGNTAKSPSPKISAKRSPRQLVSYYLKFNSEVPHDFTKNKLCLLQTEIILQNIRDEKVYINFNLYEPSKQNFTWVGVKARKFSLAPFSTLRMRNKLVFTEEGMYNISNIRILASSAINGTYVPQFSSTQNFITIGTKAL